MVGSCAQLLVETERLIEAGRPRVAALLLDAAEAREADGAQLAILRARAALKAGKPLLARGLVDTALGSFMASAELLLWRARAGLALADLEAAIADAQEALRHDPAHAPAAGLCASLLLEARRPGEAACLLDAAIASGAIDPALHQTLAIALLMLAEPDAAHTAVLRGLVAFPGHPDLQRLKDRIGSQ